jgi:hypothetical protein
MGSPYAFHQQPQTSLNLRALHRPLSSSPTSMLKPAGSFGLGAKAGGLKRSSRLENLSHSRDRSLSCLIFAVSPSDVNCLEVQTQIAGSTRRRRSSRRSPRQPVRSSGAIAPGMNASMAAMSEAVESSCAAN